MKPQITKLIDLSSVICIEKIQKAANKQKKPLAF